MFQKMFSPIKLGKLELKNRLYVAPMVTCYGEESGLVNDQYVAYVDEKTKGGWGLVTLEAHAVTEAAKSFDKFFGLYRDDQIEGQRRLTEVAHKNGCKICVQLIHGGRESLYTGSNPVAPSPIADPTSAFTPTELTIEQIKELVEEFGNAALRAKKAGYDAVEVHGAHGYLIQEFTSQYSNKRTDEYGGTLEGRAKFSLDIIRSIKEKCGSDFPVIFRMSTEEYLPEGEGIRLPDSLALAMMYEEAGADAIHSTIGNYTSIQYMLPPAAVKRGESGDLSAELKKVVNIPVINVGRYNDPYVAEAALKAGRCDMIAMARQSLADPMFPVKAQEGRVCDIRRCIGCQIGCVENLYKVVPINCTVNPWIGHELEYQNMKAKAELSKNVAVIGAGIGGLQAALVSAQRGHKVTVYEKADRVGGQWNLAAVPPYKQELTSLVTWQMKQLGDLNVEIKYNTEMTADKVLELEADEVILATGGTPIIPPFKGIDLPNVLTSTEVLYGTKTVGTSNVVIGGGDVGCETAAHIACMGKKAVVFEMASETCPKMEGSVKTFLYEYMERNHVDTYVNAKVLELKEDGIVYEQDGQQKEYKGVDNIIIAVGAKPYNPLEKELEGKVNIHVIGDAVQVRQGINAVQEATKVAYSI